MSTNLKVVTIVATFPELKDGTCHQQGSGIGPSTAVATGRALKNLLKQPGLKHRQYTTFKRSHFCRQHNVVRGLFRLQT
jgi:hypothetical protein